MIVGLTGFKQAGKDTTANLLVREFGFRKVAFGDTLRAMARALNPIMLIGEESYKGVTKLCGITYNTILEAHGYEDAKLYPEVREFLQRLGTECVRKNLGDDVWVKAVANKISASLGENWVISDVRFPNEAAFVRNAPGGVMWRIVRDGQVNTDPHESEIHIPNLPVSTTIEAGNVVELEARARAAWNAIVERQLTTRD